MPYRSPAHLDTNAAPGPIGILLTNVGSPAAPSPGALRAYLAQFLGDERIIEYPRWLWRPLLHGVILNTRPRRSARLYQRVWTDAGSPQLLILQRQAAALQAALAETGAAVMVAYGVSYGQPSIAAALRQLDAANARRVLVLPLFPQYSATTTAAALDAVFAELQTWRRLPELRTVNRYGDHPAYVAALAASIGEAWAAGGRPERLLMSFHGIPRDYADKGDPYPDECRQTAALLAAALELGEGQWAATFQSRFGPSQWLQPYTDTTLAAWGSAGLARVDAVCPGFAADCLETIDEIGREGAETFHEAGGGELRYIPALNDRPDHIAALAGVALAHLGGWLETPQQAAPRRVRA